MKKIDERIQKRLDGRENANVKSARYQPLEMKWMWSDQVDLFIQKIIDLFGKGKTIHYGPGASFQGDERVDVVKRDNVTTINSIFDIQKRYRPDQFNVGIFDLPFDYLNANSKIIQDEGKRRGLEKPGQLATNWQYEALDICSTVAIFRRNLIMINLKDVYEEFFLIRDHRPSSTIIQLAWKRSSNKFGKWA